MLVWAADIGAYFTGSRWGRRKLCPQISPNKTFAGVYGAFGAGVAVAGSCSGGLLGIARSVSPPGGG